MSFISEKDLLLVVEWLKPFNIKKLYLWNANNIYKIDLDLPLWTKMKEFKLKFDEIKKKYKRNRYSWM